MQPRLLQTPLPSLENILAVNKKTTKLGELKESRKDREGLLENKLNTLSQVVGLAISRPRASSKSFPFSISRFGLKLQTQTLPFPANNLDLKGWPKSSFGFLRKMALVALISF